MTEFDQWPELLDHLAREGGRLVVTFDPSKPLAAVAYEFGREAHDSPMAGGAAYGMGVSLTDALSQMAQELGIR